MCAAHREIIWTAFFIINVDIIRFTEYNLIIKSARICVYVYFGK